jgi:hypothetical protein
LSDFSDLKRSELEKEVSALVSAFVGVDMTHDKLVKTFNTKPDFEDSLRDRSYKTPFWP